MDFQSGAMGGAVALMVKTAFSETLKPRLLKGIVDLAGISRKGRYQITGAS